IRAAEHSQVVVIGEDTDLLVLLCFYANSDANNIVSHLILKLHLKTIHVLGEEVRKLLVFIHAFTGCDTTSRLYGIGKGATLKKTVSDEKIRNHASIFLKDSLHDEIELAGIAVITSVYGGTQCQGLDLLRYCKFVHKVQTKKSAVLVQSLPPTSTIRAAEHSQVVVIGEDTDLLVLLCFYANSDANNIVSHLILKLHLKTIHVLGEEVRKLLVFIHAFTGCDTTSRLYGIGKGATLKKTVSDEKIRNHASIFLKDSLHDEIELAGIAVITSVYGGTQCQGLDLLRYCKFVHKVQTKKSAVLVQSLPPTSSAAKSSHDKLGQPHIIDWAILT
ncbi:hypothetical protein MAR_000883, partial [Mya arenaria]